MTLVSQESCLCTAVNCELLTPPNAMSHWHCSQCRKSHGAAFASYGSVSRKLQNPYLAMGMICLALSGLYSFKSPFWALPTLFLDRTTAAVSIAVINSIGNLGGFVGPSLIGMVKGNSQSAANGLLFLSTLLLAGFLMTFFTPPSQKVVKPICYAISNYSLSVNLLLLSDSTHGSNLWNSLGYRPFRSFFTSA